uniref:BRCT domain-containing protein n=2 Tax=Kalanchoe fedtschenkoi TaxID=63787 RepID=A0A7N0U887_KALFE
MGRGGGRAVEVVSSRGCTALLTEAASSFRKNNINLQQRQPLGRDDDQLDVFRQSLPFAGLVICVTGLSKETRKQVKDATQKLGGVYSPNLHPHCTHLVLQSAVGLKLGVLLKHASMARDIYLVTIGWFVDSVRRKVRLSEELYSISQLHAVNNTNLGANGIGGFTGLMSCENPCLPANLSEHSKRSDGVEAERRIKSKKVSDSALARKSLYIDADIPPELQIKVAEAASKEGAILVKKWRAGCKVDYVVCEGSSMRRYLGRSSALVTAEWVLRTAKAGKSERLVHMSKDLAEQVGK